MRRLRYMVVNLRMKDRLEIYAKMLKEEGVDFANEVFAGIALKGQVIQRPKKIPTFGFNEKFIRKFMRKRRKPRT